MSSERVQAGVSGIGTNDVAISVDDVSKCYRIFPGNKARLRQAFFPGRKYYEEFWALKNISFEVKRGEAFGIVGPNGAGKSTLLQILAGILQPTSGKVEQNGRVSAMLELGAGFDPLYTGRENAYMNGTIIGLSRKDMDRRMDMIRDFADIGDFFDRPVWMYSSGMHARLAFAVSVSVDPDILIIDEVLSVGDLAFRRKCYDRIVALKEMNATILFVSHDLSSVENVCSEAILLEKGQVVKAGRSSEVVNHYQGGLEDSSFIPGELILEDFYKDLELQRTSMWNVEPHHFQTGEVELRKVLILNENDEPCTSFKSSDRLKVRIEYFAKKKIADPVFMVTFYNSNGIHCRGNRTVKGGVSSENIQINEIKGEGWFEADFGEIRLNSDTYMVGAAIFDPLITIPYALSRSIKIKVSADSWNSMVGIRTPIVLAQIDWRFS